MYEEIEHDKEGRERSQAFRQFLKWFSRMGSKDGRVKYPPRLLDELHPWERDYVEAMVYEKLMNSKSHAFYAFYFAELFPHLKNYKGIKALKQYIKDHDDESPHVMVVAPVLYETTSKLKYLYLLMRLYRQSRHIESDSISIIGRCKPRRTLFKALAYIFVKDDDLINRRRAGYYMLQHKGYDTKGFDAGGKLSEDEMKLKWLFLTDKTRERRRLVKKLATGQPLIEGVPAPESLG